VAENRIDRMVDGVHAHDGLNAVNAYAITIETSG